MKFSRVWIILQKFRVELFSWIEEFQKLRGDKFSRIDENCVKSLKINLREN